MSDFTVAIGMPGQLVDPAVSFKPAHYSEVDPTVRDYLDVAGRVRLAGRDRRSASPAILDDPVQPDDDSASADALGNVDPADTRSTRRPVEEFAPGWVPNVEISREYRYRLQIAERALELAAERLPAVVIVGRLAERFDETEPDVWAILEWMGVLPDLARVRSVKTNVKHGTVSAYTHHGCRCEVCREANRNRRIERLGLDPSTVARYNTRFSGQRDSSRTSCH